MHGPFAKAMYVSSLCLLLGLMVVTCPLGRSIELPQDQYSCTTLNCTNAIIPGYPDCSFVNSTGQDKFCNQDPPGYSKNACCVIFPNQKWTCTGKDTKTGQDCVAEYIRCTKTVAVGQGCS